MPNSAMNDFTDFLRGIQTIGIPLVLLMTFALQTAIVYFTKELNLQISAIAGVIAGLILCAIYTIQLLEGKIESALVFFATQIPFLVVLFLGFVIGIALMFLTEFLFQSGIFGVVTLMLTATGSISFITYLFSRSLSNATIGDALLSNLTNLTFAMLFGVLAYIAVRPNIISHLRK